MTEQYLILHKVRGEPCFDTATTIEVDGEQWFITNAGHRAYPVDKWPVEDILLSLGMQNMIPTVPDDWPDHFEVRNEGPKAKVDLSKIMSALVPKIRRRI